MCYYYENKTKDKRLKEKLNIKNNSNIEFLNQPEGTNEINIVLDPGQNYFVELKSKTIFGKYNLISHIILKLLINEIFFLSDLIF